MDLLSGDLTIKPRSFQEIIPNFLWLKDDNSVILLEKEESKNKWEMKIYNNKIDLIFNYVNIKGRKIDLLGLSPDEKEVCLFIENQKKSGLYRVNLHSRELCKITSLSAEEIKSYYWVVNDRLFYTTADKMRNKAQSIWSMSIDGSSKEPIFEELHDTYEEIITVAADGRWLALNVFDNGIIKSGLLDTRTGEIQYLPTIDEKIKAVSSNGETVITVNHDLGQSYLYKTSNGKKWKIPLNDLAHNLRFCIDDEFLVYTTNINNQPIVELFDLVTHSSNPIAEIGKNINQIHNEVVIF